jgi:hypothetical protein
MHDDPGGVRAVPVVARQEGSPMSPVELQIRDAGPLGVDVEEEQIDFEDGTDPGRGIEACLADPFPTATTRLGCD